MNYYNKLVKIVIQILEDTEIGKKTTATTLSKKTNTTYCHTNNVIKLLEKNNLISRKQEGRKILITIIDKEFFNSVKGFYNLFKNKGVFN